MSMIPPSADSGGLAGRASSRISGNPSSRSCKRRPTCRPWKSCGEFGERATRGARAHFTRWWPPCGRRRSSPWFVLRVCRENSASTTSDRWTSEFIDGTARRIRFFASRLKYSRWMRVSVVKDETVESLVRSLAQHLDSWGGAPLVWVFDRPKTGALKWRGKGGGGGWERAAAGATLG